MHMYPTSRTAPNPLILTHLKPTLPFAKRSVKDANLTSNLCQVFAAWAHIKDNRHKAITNRNTATAATQKSTITNTKMQHNNTKMHRYPRTHYTRCNPAVSCGIEPMLAALIRRPWWMDGSSLVPLVFERMKRFDAMGLRGPFIFGSQKMGPQNCAILR